jgi:hypothetical protein
MLDRLVVGDIDNVVDLGRVEAAVGTVTMEVDWGLPVFIPGVGEGEVTLLVISIPVGVDDTGSTDCSPRLEIVDENSPPADVTDKLLAMVSTGEVDPPYTQSEPSGIDGP